MCACVCVCVCCVQLGIMCILCIIMRREALDIACCFPIGTNTVTNACTVVLVHVVHASMAGKEFLAVDWQF